MVSFRKSSDRRHHAGRRRVMLEKRVVRDVVLGGRRNIKNKCGADATAARGAIRIRHGQVAMIPRAKIKRNAAGARAQRRFERILVELGAGGGNGSPGVLWQKSSTPSSAADIRCQHRISADQSKMDQKL